MKYFETFQDINELKRQYKKLALKLHPDMGGSKADFQAMSAEYEKLLKNALNGRFDSSERVEEEMKMDQEMREALNLIINLEGVIIEIVGNWIWVTGNTMPVKESLKDASYRFARKKCAWYWNDGTFKKKSKKSLSLDEIKAKFGSQTVKKEYKNLQLA